MNLEDEVKLEAELGFECPRFDIDPTIARVELRPVKHTVTIYFDLPDGQLSVSGLALRFRFIVDANTNDNVDLLKNLRGHQIGEWAMKSGGTSVENDGVIAISRDEFEIEGEFFQIPDRMVEMFSQLQGARESLVIIAGLEARRTTTNVIGDSGSLVAVDDDVVDVIAGPALGHRFREIELELLSDSGRAIRSKIVGDLIACGARYSTVGSKLERALLV